MINGSIESLRPSADLRALLNKTVLCVDMRSKALSAETEAAAKAGPTIDQMKLLSPCTCVACPTYHIYAARRGTPQSSTQQRARLQCVAGTAPRLLAS